MPTFKRTMQDLDGKIAQEQPKEAPKPIEPKQYNPAKEFNPKRDFVKPLAKWEAAEAKKQGISNDEYRYEKAKDYALLMGEQLPNKDKFMKDLAEKRGNPTNTQPKEEPAKEDLFAESENAEQMDEIRKAFPKFVKDSAEIRAAQDDDPYSKVFDEDALRDNIVDLGGSSLEEEELEQLTKELSEAMQRAGFENATRNPKYLLQKEEPKQEEDEIERFDDEMQYSYDYIYKGLPRNRQIAIFAERMDITPEKAKEYFDLLDKRNAEQKKKIKAKKEQEEKTSKANEQKRVLGLVEQLREAKRAKNDELAQSIIDQILNPDNLPF